MDEKKQTVETVDLFEILLKLLKQAKRLWWLMFLILGICIGGMVFRTVYRYTPHYQATATYAASGGIDGLTDISSASNYYDTQTREQIVSTFSYIFATEGMRGRIKNMLGLAEIPGEVAVSAIGDTYYFKMTATAGSPETALALLEATAACYPDAASFVIGTSSLTEIEAPHSATTPINPLNYTGAVVKGLIIGLAICVLLLWLASVRRRTVESKADMKEICKLRYLGAVPTIHIKKRRNDSAALLTLMNTRISSALEPSVGAIRTQLLRRLKESGDGEQAGRLVMVTSTYAGEGKTTISVNLAISLARSGKKVILVDADLRNQSVRGRFNLKGNAFGLMELIRNEKVPVARAIVTLGELPLGIIAGERCTDAPLDLLDTPRAAAIFKELRALADIVIIDSPPSGLLTDAAKIGRLTDGVVYVVRVNGAPRRQISENLKELEKHGLPLTGYVLNGVDSSEAVTYGTYGRYGAYGKYGKYGKYGSYGSYGKSKRKSKT